MRCGGSIVFFFLSNLILLLDFLCVFLFYECCVYVIVGDAHCDGSFFIDLDVCLFMYLLSLCDFQYVG